MLVVATSGYFYSLGIKTCDKRLENNFYYALSHDLPESLTCDIISSTKYGIDGLHTITNGYEMKLINDGILPFIPEGLRAKFSYILGIREGKSNGASFVRNEFENRTCENAKVKLCSGGLNSFNQNELGAIGGKALKYCDETAAFIEAGSSISYEVKSKELENGFKSMFEFFNKNPTISGVNSLEICREFRDYFKI